MAVYDYDSRDSYYSKQFYYCKEDIKEKDSFNFFKVISIILAVVCLIISVSKAVDFTKINSEFLTIILFVSAPFIIFTLGYFGVLYDKERGYD